MIPDTEESTPSSAIQEAEAAAENVHSHTETGAPEGSTVQEVQNKQRGGLTGTEAALGILGAGQPYPTGSY